MTALTRVVRDMLDSRENDEQITVEVSLLWSLIYEAETMTFDIERLAVAINDAQVMGSEWWGRDLIPVAEKIARKYQKAGEK